jgi:hypothetical protein
MSTAALATELLFPSFSGPSPNSPKVSALRSLMQMWEEEAVAEDGESESELMVMLSGMVGSHATVVDGE